MKQFISPDDAGDIEPLIQEAIALQKNTWMPEIGKGQTLGLVFMNPSLRTRMSTQKAAFNLGMNVMVMNLGQDSWNIETEDGAIMNGSSQEHIKDAVQVMSLYCDVLGIRSFPELQSVASDYSETVINAFVKYSSVPVISLESATRHPLQSLADLITIRQTGILKPRVAVTWAPHPRTLPQAVTNSFLEWCQLTDAQIILAHPVGYALKDTFTNGLEITNNQEEALEGADFVYTKNWSSYEHYGQTPAVTEDWTITSEKMALTNQGKFMHCLPIRRNVVATDEVIDQSIVYQQAKNREYAAQVVLKRILEAKEN